MDPPDALRVLRREGRDRRHGVAAMRRDDLDIGLDAGAAGRVGAGDREDSGNGVCLGVRHDRGGGFAGLREGESGLACGGFSRRAQHRNIAGRGTGFRPGCLYYTIALGISTDCLQTGDAGAGGCRVRCGAGDRVRAAAPQ